jgi:hypothetical protein
MGSGIRAPGEKGCKRKDNDREGCDGFHDRGIGQWITSGRGRNCRKIKEGASGPLSFYGRGKG